MKTIFKEICRLASNKAFENFKKSIIVVDENEEPYEDMDKEELRPVFEAGFVAGVTSALGALKRDNDKKNTNKDKDE